MSDVVCINCNRSQAPFRCGICEQAICKRCVQFAEEDAFSLMGVVPKDLTHGRYCGPCFDEKVAPLLADYNDTVEKAKQVLVFHLDDMNETRLFSRQNKPLTVRDCTDKDKAMMVLAYAAVKGGSNTLIDVEITSEKVHISGYRTSKWHARGTPVKLDNYFPNRKRRFIGKPPEPSARG